MVVELEFKCQNPYSK